MSWLFGKKKKKAPVQPTINNNEKQELSRQAAAHKLNMNIA